MVRVQQCDNSKDAVPHYMPIEVHYVRTHDLFPVDFRCSSQNLYFTHRSLDVNKSLRTLIFSTQMTIRHFKRDANNVKIIGVSNFKSS